jgi:hypothetical protein
MLVFDNVIASIILTVLAIFGIYFTRTPKAQSLRELGLTNLVLSVCVLGLFMAVVLIIV